MKHETMGVLRAITMGLQHNILANLPLHLDRIECGNSVDGIIQLKRSMEESIDMTYSELDRMIDHARKKETDNQPG